MSVLGAAGKAEVNNCWDGGNLSGRLSVLEATTHGEDEMQRAMFKSLSAPTAGLGALLIALASSAATAPVVHTALGGAIIGYDVDQNGTEGILAEYVSLNGGKNNVAVETFDQATGDIIKIVKEQDDTYNDFVALGVAGKHTGVVMYERSDGTRVTKRIFKLLDPLRKNRFTGLWTPSFNQDELLAGISETQGSSVNAIMGLENDGSFRTFLFSSDIAANTFGPRVDLTDSLFDNAPPMAFDSRTNKAVVAASIGCRTCTPTLALVDLVSAKVKEFAGIGLGTVNGIAVDSADGIACTSTEIDFSVEFYDLKNKTGFLVQLQGASSQEQSGTDVEYDSVNGLFLVAQPFTSTGNSGSSIQVFDTKGNFVEAINGLSLPTGGARIALNPNTRTGFVWVTPAGTELQGFTY